MTAAASLSGLIIILVRVLSGHLHPFQIVFFRNLISLILMLPWIVRDRNHLRTTLLKWHLFRALLALAALLAWFYALTITPLAEAVALSFMAPIFATVGAALFLKEHVGWRRWSASCAGFGGVLVIVRPGEHFFGPGVLLVLFSAAAMGASMLVIKHLCHRDSIHLIVFYLGLLVTPLSLAPATLFWRPMDWGAAFPLFLLGCFATLTQACLTKAFAISEVSAVLPFDYLRLPVTAFAAYWLFSEVPDFWVWAGGGLIFGAAAYIARREALGGRRHGLTNVTRLQAAPGGVVKSEK